MGFLILTACTTPIKELSSDEKQDALKNGKAVVNLEWNYHGNQLYTIWFNKADLNKDYIPFYWLTGNNYIPLAGPHGMGDFKLVETPSENKARTFVLEAGEYVMWAAQSGYARPFHKLGEVWAQYQIHIGKSGETIRKNLKEKKYFATFVVKAGQEITLPKIDVLYDQYNYKNAQYNDTDTKLFVTEDTANANAVYTFGSYIKTIK